MKENSERYRVDGFRHHRPLQTIIDNFVSILTKWLHTYCRRSPFLPVCTRATDLSHQRRQKSNRQFGTLLLLILLIVTGSDQSLYAQVAQIDSPTDDTVVEAAGGSGSIDAMSSDWFAFDLPWDDSSATPINASDLLLAPGESGGDMAALIDARGFVTTNADGHFIFSNTGQRVRFWGININASAVYPPSPDHPAEGNNEIADNQAAEKVAARFAKLGFNAVRLHHMDTWSRPSGIWLNPSANTQQMDPVQLARLDYLIYQFKRHGIYVNLNLHVSRNFVQGDGFTAAAEMRASNISFNKATTLFDPVAIGLQQKYAQELLAHVNPYTGLSYANDPVIFTTETTNEDSFFWTFLFDHLNHEPARAGSLPPFYSQQLDGWTQVAGSGSSLNRLVNPGFEAGLTSWFTQNSASTSAAFGIDTNNPYAENQALRIDVTQVSGTNWDIQFGQSGLAVQAGQRYRLRFAVRADAPTTIGGAVMRNVSPYDALGWADTINVTTEWQQQSIEFDATDTDYGDARVSFNVGTQSGILWFDDFQLQEVDPFAGWMGWLEQKYGSTAALAAAWAPQGSVSGGEMLTNRGFETGVTQWATQVSPNNQATWSVDSAEATEGTQSLRIDITQADGASWHIQCWQAGLTVVKGQAYQLSYDLKSNEAGQMSLNIMQDHVPWQQLGWETTVEATTSWQRQEHIFTANQDDTNARITLQVGQSGPRTLWLDNISLKPIVREGLLASESLEANNVTRIRFTDRLGYSTARLRDTVQFYEETQRVYFQQMQRFIQNDVGSQSLNTGTATLGLPDVRAMADLDFVDTHYYWDHPWWPDGAWQPTGWIIQNRSWLNSPFAAFFNIASGAVQDKPFTVTEFNSANPNRYAIETPLLMALMGNLQDWDGLFLFAYVHNQLAYDNDAMVSFFDLVGNPVATGMMPVVARLFLDTQTAPAPTLSPLRLTADERYASMNYGSSIDSFLQNDKGVEPAAVFGGRLRITDFDAATPHTLTLPAPTGPIYQSAGGQLTWDTSETNRGHFTFDAPHAQGVIGFIDGKQFNLTDITLNIPAQAAEFGAITVQSLDDQPLATSRELLLGVFTRAENTGMVWNAEENSVNDQWGSAPVLIQPLTFDITLTLSDAQRARTWVLDETGTPRMPIDHQIFNATQISFTVDTAIHQTLWYRIHLDSQTQSPEEIIYYPIFIVD
ncbi:MAG: carbohydrate binding domain-containing protein [Chloroflexota bacterium]